MTVPHDMTEVRRAFQLHQEGRLEEAGRLYSEALANDPRDANALHLFGVLQGQRADFEAAAVLIGRALDRIADHTVIIGERLRYLLTGDTRYLASEVR